MNEAKEMDWKCVLCCVFFPGNSQFLPQAPQRLSKKHFEYSLHHLPVSVGSWQSIATVGNTKPERKGGEKF